MDASELQRITGQHQLFLGIGTHAWSLDQFRQCARFAHSHGVDTLLVKTFDGGNFWYGGYSGWQARKAVILAEGVGAIPYGYCYGNKFGALDTEIDYLIWHMQNDGIACANMEVEYNGQTGWASHLCRRIQPVQGVFLVSTWSDPSLQNWLGVIRALAPCVDVWCPQQYNNFLAKFWPEFGNNGAVWLQPTLNLTQDFGANDPVQIARAAADQGHTGISVWHYDTAVANPGLLDAVFAAFPKGEPVNNTTYGPGKGDFETYFERIDDNHWRCKKFDTIIGLGDLSLYKQLSLDGKLPVIGLPRTNETYQHDSDGYVWSVQFFERGLIVYDEQHKHDGQPGMESCYIGKYEQFQQYDPDARTIEVVPAALKADIDTLPKLVSTMSDTWNIAIAKIRHDAGIP